MLPQFVPVTPHVTHQHVEAKRCSSEEHLPAVADCAPLLDGSSQPKSGPARYEVHCCHSCQAILTLRASYGTNLTNLADQGLPQRHAYPACPGSKSVLVA